jgi:trk system potassium uptake protein TrkH
MLSKQKIHYQAILGNVGLLLHVPACMAFFSLIICLLFHDRTGCEALLFTGGISLFLGQLWYRLFFRPQVCHLWDAMITAAIGWLACSLIGALPFYMTGSASHAFLDALFESFSGFTSTGLTMITHPSKLPPVLQWWRSLTQWVGGIGLVVFIISIVEPHREEYQLYYAETRSDRIGKTIRQTAQLIWGIYCFYTLVSFGLLFIAGMPLWDAINHALCGIATGGFSIAEHNMQDYPWTAQLALVFVMILGTISFSMHYRMVKKGKVSWLWKSPQHRWLLLLFVIGGVVVLLLNVLHFRKWLWMDSFFQWVSALGTCGFYTKPLQDFGPAVILLFIAGMMVGGASGSTTGGIKMRRLRNLFLGIVVQVKSITKEKEKTILQAPLVQDEPSDIALPKTEKTARLYAAGVLFLLWVISLVVGWFFLLLWSPKTDALHALFEAASALGNVGLSMGITSPDLAMGGKWVLIILMWIGRLEIIPFLILLFSLTFPFQRRQS